MTGRTRESCLSQFIDLGQNRFKYYQARHQEQFGKKQKGRLLDFGCGEGKFLFAALREGIDVYGIEVDPVRQTQFMRNAERYDQRAASRFRLYDGRLIPFPSNCFDGCHSYFVFEHVTDPQISLREIVRILKPGGTLSIFADDVRNAWDGHAKVPWPPYMPRDFASAYLEGLGLSHHAEFITKYVVYISAPIIADILTTLGMEVVYAGPKPDRNLLREGLYVTNEAEARALGAKIKLLGNYESPRENLTIYARKLAS